MDHLARRVLWASSEVVQGLDSLSANIPHYAERFVEMARDTEAIATELEDRMKYLEDGYDYLSKVSSQVPEAIREMSSNYKTGMLDGAEVNLFGEEEKRDLEDEDDKLDHLKKELHSISQERVIVDVFTRSTISRVKSHFTKVGVDNEPAFIGSDMAEKSRLQTRSYALARHNSVDKGVKNEVRNSKPLLQTEHPEKFGQGAGPAFRPQPPAHMKNRITEGLGDSEPRPNVLPLPACPRGLAQRQTAYIRPA